MPKWFKTLEANQSYPIETGGTLRLDLASLTVDAKPGKTRLKVRKDDHEFTLCLLEQGNIEHQRLDISFADDDDCSLVLSGVNSLSLMGVYTEDDDPDFEIDSDDEEDEEIFGGFRRFDDPSDNAYRGGFELAHFGLMPRMTAKMEDLRKEEATDEDSQLHDNIALGLINAMLNTNDEYEVRQAKKLKKKLEKDRRARYQKSHNT